MREKKRFNFIDVIILLCVALIVLAVVFRAQITGYIAGGKNLVGYSVAFQSEPVENGIVGYIKSGNTVEWVEKGIEIGTVNALNAPADAEIYTLSSDGKLIVAPSTSAKKLSGTLAIMGYEKDGGCFVSGTEFIGAGMKMTLRSGNTVFTVTVLSVTKN